MGVGPLPGAEVRRAALEQSVGQRHVVVEVLAAGEIHPADRVAKAELIGLLGRLDRLGERDHTLLVGQAALLLGSLLLAADQDDPRRQGDDRRQQQGCRAGDDRLVTTSPARQPGRGRLAIGGDRVVGEPSVDLVGQPGGRGVPVAGLLGHRLEADGLQAPGDARFT